MRRSKLGHVFLLWQHLLQRVEPSLEHLDFGLELGQPARRLLRLLDVGPQAREPIQPGGKFRFCRPNVKAVEAGNGHDRQPEEGAELHVPGKLTEIQDPSWVLPNIRVVLTDLATDTRP